MYHSLNQKKTAQSLRDHLYFYISNVFRQSHCIYIHVHFPVQSQILNI